MIFLGTEHCEGRKLLPPAHKKEIEAAIAAITPPTSKGGSAKMRFAFLSSLKISGWTDELIVAPNSGMTITSYRDGVGLCFQTGNMARMYADLMKLQTMYLNGAINVAAIVLPSSTTAKLLGSNIAAAERLERELVVFRKTYHVPTAIYSLEVSE
ncbi:hypothetical protein [uncultured Luteimonas sp.]|uniref:hypothetical protein n=1 Tax=uncultured Luteimonas sp. TaxID=453144 RepID=UPI0026397FC3|nr:hypothetical protein [uncultured Luteimonas sp.]